MDDVWCATNHTKDGGECVKVLGWMMSGVLLTTPEGDSKERGKKEKKTHPCSCMRGKRVEFVLFVCKLLDMSFPSNGNWVPPSGYAEAFAKDLGNSPEKIYSPLMLLTWSYEHYE
jgi:hypothetical protein